jgi:hypothetical protein
VAGQRTKVCVYDIATRDLMGWKVHCGRRFFCSFLPGFGAVSYLSMIPWRESLEGPDTGVGRDEKCRVEGAGGLVFISSGLGYKGD